MTSVNELMKVGQELGYTDEALRNFVKEEQAREREERHKAEKDRLELEARLAKEKLDYEVQISKEKLEIEIGMEREKLSNEASVAKEKLDYARQLEREKEEAEARKLDTEYKMKIELDMLARISRYLDGWLRLSKVEKTYEKLLDFIVRDQFLDICNRELYQNLSSKKLFSAREVAEDADLFAKTRGGPKYVVNHGIKERAKPYALPSRPVDRNQGSSYRMQRGNDRLVNRGRASQQYEGYKCTYCGRLGHTAFFCRNKATNKANAAEDIEPNSMNPSKNDNSYQGNRRRGGYRGRSRGRGRNRDADSKISMPRSDSGSSLIELGDFEDVGTVTINSCPTTRGICNGKAIVAMRDTGCTCVIVRRNLVNANQLLGKSRRCKYIDGSEHRLEMALIDLDCPYYRGTVEALCVDNPTNDVIIGNIEGAVEPNLILDITNVEFVEKQQADRSLDGCRKKAEEGTVRNCRGKGQVKFQVRNKMLFREFTAGNGDVSRQLVVPKDLRETVLKVAHDSLLAGHLGIRKTSDRVLGEFYWPGVLVEVRRYCQSCDICQRTISKGRISKVTLGKMPLIDTPFKRVAVDIVGPIEPMTDRKNRYILTMVDYATRYPEAIALPSIETERVAEALVDMYSRLGVPEEMLTDCGSQFTSQIMNEVSRLLSLRQLTTTPYHPMCNGLVEKFNGSLKQMLKRMCSERPTDWDKYLNAMLFAYREVPQESLGFSPFELLYGRSIRGPITILRELWSGKTENDEVKTTYQYVVDLQERLESTCKIAQQELEKSSIRYRKYYNRKARDRTFKKGSKVLVLIPTKRNKLLLQWKGPFVVSEVVNKLDYRIDIGNNKIKTFHANMLKEYVERNFEPERGALAKVSAAVVEAENGYDRLEEDDSLETSYQDDSDILLCPLKKGSETYKDVQVNPDLQTDCKTQIATLLKKFSDVLTDIPGNTSLVQHDIKLTTSEPVRTKGYPIPFHSQQIVKEEVDKMLELGVIEPSNAPFSSPIVLIRKKDNTIRFCIDFRQINKCTVFDAEPMPNMEQIFSKLSKYRYFSKIDLSKGYWQVPLSDNAKPLTAFETPSGLFQFRKMPFGLVNAPATFCRLMRKVLKDLDHSDSFIDDILIYTVTLPEHINALYELFTQLRESRLTARPSNVSYVFEKLECLGHMIGGSKSIEPVLSKVKAIQETERPTTKRGVRQFLGVVSWYRKFIPNFAAIAVPLTDLTKKFQPNRIEWGESQEKAFQTLKASLTGPPILKLPDLDKMFILRVDASDCGLGSVLLQEKVRRNFQ
ncbi:uncharacterized protein LOC132737428 [Ruditapes philippinarum]|uniref:uncharacterized protein LOC132737428 n=1 Tax=Ruditapes philippinarum TaxID=129788 RepID=UPI00295BCD69|nr:uncharacterized protein LOC132737428 [Ruditapes philippinarum]